MAKSLFLSVLLLSLPPLFAATGRITLETRPAGAEVWFSPAGSADRKYLGDTPLQYRELPAGAYDFLLALADHDSVLLTAIRLSPGDHLRLERDLKGRYGHLEAASFPDSAEILLDRTRIGFTPYSNPLMLPGTYRLRMLPKDAHLRPLSLPLSIRSGDTVRLRRSFSYRDKNFGREHLSVVPGRLQVEAGLFRFRLTGHYDSSGKARNLPTDAVGTAWSLPFTLRYGLPSDIEVHLAWPFAVHYATDTGAAESGLSDLSFGAKYTYRPLGIGADFTYTLATGDADQGLGLNHDRLALSLLGFLGKGRVIAHLQGGYEFHFADRDDRKFDPGDQALLYGQAGYVLAPFIPYLGLEGRFTFKDEYDGQAGDSSGTGTTLPGAGAAAGAVEGGYVLQPEVGVLADLSDRLSLQAGIPFTILGKNGRKGWGFHLSVQIGLL